VFHKQQDGTFHSLPHNRLLKIESHLASRDLLELDLPDIHESSLSRRTTTYEMVKHLFRQIQNFTVVLALAMENPDPLSFYC